MCGFQQIILNMPFAEDCLANSVNVSDLQTAPKSTSPKPNLLVASPIIAPVEYAEDIEEPPRSPSPSCSDAGRMEALQDVPDATGKLSESRYSRRAVGRISKYPAGSVPVKPELADS